MPNFPTVGTVTLLNDTVFQLLPAGQAAVVLASISVAGGFNGTLTFEASLDGVTFTPVNAFNGAIVAQTTGAAGDWEISSLGFAAVRVRLSAVGVGSATITLAPATAGTLSLIAGVVSTAVVNPNADGVIFASAAQTLTQTQPDQINNNARGIVVILDMTAVGTGSVTLEIDGKDPASGKYFALLTGAAVITNVTNVYTIFPGATAAANVTANAELTHTYRVRVTANNANPATYSVGFSLLA